MTSFYSSGFSCPFSTRRWRSRLVGELTGQVLEIGLGEGGNLPYYQRAEHVWGIEPDEVRVAQARKNAQYAPRPVTVENGVAEALPYADAFFDHVVSSLVFCSVTDQRQALTEIRRVLKPGGVLHMIEHVRPQTAWLAWLFTKVTPRWSRIANNCHLDRPTVAVLRECGWQVTIHKQRFMLVRMSAE